MNERYANVLRSGAALFPARLASMDYQRVWYVDSLVDLPLEDVHRNRRGDFPFRVVPNKGRPEDVDPDDFVLIRWLDAGSPPRLLLSGKYAYPSGSFAGYLSKEQAFALRDQLRALEAILETLPDAALDSAVATELLSTLTGPEQPAIAPVLADWLGRAVAQERAAALIRRQALDSDAERVRRESADLEPVRVFMRAIGAPDRPAETPDSDAVPSLDHLDAALGSIATRLVRRAMLVSMFTAALTGSLVLLDGPVGTGKTTLAERVAGAAGGRSQVIPVRPSWVEPADLLGYYEPLSRVFRPGPLAEALVHAPEGRLTAVVLDELNLARIENYASDILSRLERIADSQWDGRNDGPGISAWSRSEYLALKHEVEVLQSIEKRSPEQEFRRLHIEGALRYTPELQVRDAAVVVGTLNTDDTTFDISPKVIDRSFVLAFPTAQLATIYVAGSPCGGVSIKALRAAAKAAHRPGFETREWRTIEQLLSQEQMAAIGVPYSHRLVHDLSVFLAVAEVLGLTGDEVVSMFVFTRVLPRVRYFVEKNRTEVARGLLDRLAKPPFPARDPAWKAATGRIGRQVDDKTASVVRYFRSDGA